MFGTCAQSCAVPLPTRLPVITCSPTAKNFFRNEDTPLTDYKEGHAQEAAEFTQNLSFWQRPVQLLCVYGVAPWKTFQQQVLILFCSLSMNIHNILWVCIYFFFYPSNYFLPHSSLSGPFVMYISGMFLSILQQQKVMLSFIYFSCLPYL